VEHKDSQLMKNIKVLLFDLGGVLLQLNSHREVFSLPMDESEFLSRWLRSPAVREFERGAIAAESFAKAIVIEADLPYDWREFLERFHAWPDELYPGITDLLDRIPPNYQRALLSNTNAIHWQHEGIADKLTNRFEYVFLSYVTGRLKPDHEAFQLVQDQLSCQASQIVLFDDNPANVAAAKEFGFQSILTRGADELRMSLIQLGIAD
jgi:putative hydrolase of the HAD superfamily